jgi:Bacterial extracellular solute-binding protein
VNAGPRRGRSYRPERKRRTRTAALTGLSAVIAATLLLALGARAVVSRTDCTSHPLVVNVVTASEIGPVVRHIGQYFNRQHQRVNGRCVHVAVTAEPPGTVAAQLAGKAPSHGPLADAWIPDSGLWAALAGAAGGAGHVRLSGITLARTALVIAMPRPAAARSPAFGSSVSWKFLLPQNAGGPASALRLHIEFPDPASSITGLVALTELQRLCGRGEAAQTALASFAVHVQTEPAPGGTLPLASLAAWVPPPGTGAATAPVTITTEQAVIQFDRAHPRQPLAVRYPAEGSEELSYPYVLTTADPLMLVAAGRFGKLLRSAYAASYARYEGFRSADGVAGDWPAVSGLARSGPHLLPPPSPAQAGAALRTWQQLSLGARALTLIDSSAAMAARARPGGPDLEQLLARGAGSGLALFPDSTQMGLWTFPSHSVDGLPYQELVPIGPIADPLGQVTRRQQIQRLTRSGLLPVPRTQAALYSTILDAYRLMLATYQPRRINAVLVLTAGVDHNRGDISAATLVSDLRVLYDPRRPVRIVAIMLGRGGDLRALQRIAATTNGQAIAITRYSRLGQVIFQTATQALCRPSCASPSAS